MAVKDRIQVRIDHDIKKKAEENLKAKGLTLSEYTRIMVANVAFGDVTVKLETPNSTLNDSIQEAADFLSGKKKLQGYSDAESLEKGLME